MLTNAASGVDCSCSDEADSAGTLLWQLDHDDDDTTPDRCAGMAYSTGYINSYSPYAYDAVVSLAMAATAAGDDFDGPSLLEALRDGVGLGRLELGERAQGARVEAVAHGLAERRRPESRGRGLHARRGRPQRQAAEACRARRHGRVVRRAQGAEAEVARRGRRQRDAERSPRVARRHDLVDARRREAAEAAQRRRGDCRVHRARSASPVLSYTLFAWPRWLAATTRAFALL